MPGFPFFGAPGRAHSLEGKAIQVAKFFTDPTGGTVSRTARVSTVRLNLKEADGKALA